MEKFYEHIEDYLLGELSGPDLADFEAALRTDTALAKSVEQHREMIQRLNALRLRNRVKASLNKPAKKVMLYTTRSFLAIAASLTLLAAAIWFFSRPDQPSNPMANETPAPPVQTQTPAENSPIAELPVPEPEKNTPAPQNEQSGRQLALAREFLIRPSTDMVRDAAQAPETSDTATPAQKAAAAFEQENYRLVNELLSAEETIANDPAARFIRASARFQLGQYAAAARDYGLLKNSFQFKHEASWNHLQCQLALNNNATATVMLDAMIQDTDYPYRQKALELRKKWSVK
jgi:hypothetical protein